MKKTGMVRKLDELGRIVIPKEIRNVLKLKVGMQLEIYINENGELVLKEYYPVKELKKLADLICEILSDNIGKNIFISDRKEIVSASGKNKKNLLHKNISTELVALMEERKNYIASSLENETIIQVVEGENFIIYSQLFFPLVVCGEVEGMIGILDSNEENISENDIKIIEIVAKFIQRQLENE